MNLYEKFELSIGNNINGFDLSIKGYKFFNGKGPSIYIQGGTHGGEITFPVFFLLNKFLKSNKNWVGTVTLIPLAHPISWTQRSYFHTLGKFNNCDGKDWNRAFPGNANGSTADRISNVIFLEASKHDITIDLHTSRRSNPFLIISKKDLILECAKSGISPIYLAEKTESNHPLPDAIDKIGKKGITIECGSHDSMDKKNAKKCFESILNIMRSEGVLLDKKSTKINNNAFVFTKYYTYYAPISGFVDYLHPLEKIIKKGESIYRIYNSSNLGEKIDIIAEEDCLIMKYQTTHAVTIGDEIVTVVPKNNIKKVDQFI